MSRNQGKEDSHSTPLLRSSMPKAFPVTTRGRGGKITLLPSPAQPDQQKETSFCQLDIGPEDATGPSAPSYDAISPLPPDIESQLLGAQSDEDMPEDQPQPFVYQPPMTAPQVTVQEGSIAGRPSDIPRKRPRVEDQDASDPTTARHLVIVGGTETAMTVGEIASRLFAKLERIEHGASTMENRVTALERRMNSMTVAQAAAASQQLLARATPAPPMGAQPLIIPGVAGPAQPGAAGLAVPLAAARTLAPAGENLSPDACGWD